MRFQLALLSVLAAAIASPIHEHHEHKRDVETVYVTEVITAQAQIPSTSTGASIISSSVAKSFSPKSYSSSSGTTYLAPSSSQSATSIQLRSSSTSTSSSSTLSSSSSSASSTSTGITSGAKGITYSPYTDSGSCKDADTIQSDIAKLSGFDYIRLYDTDCSGVENVLAAKTSSQKLFAGIYYLAKVDSSVEILKNAVASTSGGWDEIFTVSIGNELINSGDATVSEIGAAVTSARAALTSAGYSGTVVSVDTLVAVQNNPTLCDYSDFVAVNSHPFWDGSVYPADSGSWLKQQISNIKSVCGGSKDVLITETGWPTQGDDYGVAVPSTENQNTAIESIISEVGDQVILFTTYNDLWKDAGSYGVEKYWGIFN
ncbi:hypothetical protein WICMUC_003785 [Wickerhamomyces mucosus]|uniref:Uncharacterized protein n=1 Tax=Wickerhamomyces mucosus TaxID=1378264 RepID=A0A9P8TCD3_9ASCO|nr:hypothetical protein WICMUC_003785 [Wickerhamomyces mucosus]